jgi:hypothetical protein
LVVAGVLLVDDEWEAHCVELGESEFFLDGLTVAVSD